MIPAGEKAKRDIVDRFYWDTRVDANHAQVEVRVGKANLTGIASISRPGA